MTAKRHFLKKLQTHQSHLHPFVSKNQEDITRFLQGMSRLAESMIECLADTGIQQEISAVSLIDLLVDSRAFELPGITLHYENRSIRFLPVFLYGHGVTGCVEVSLCFDGKVIPQCRLFIHTHWTCTSKGALSQPNRMFDEDAFFEMLDGLLS